MFLPFELYTRNEYFRYSYHSEQSMKLNTNTRSKKHTPHEGSHLSSRSSLRKDDQKTFWNPGLTWSLPCLTREIHRISYGSRLRNFFSRKRERYQNLCSMYRQGRSQKTSFRIWRSGRTEMRSPYRNCHSHLWSSQARERHFCRRDYPPGS